MAYIVLQRSKVDALRIPMASVIVRKECGSGRVPVAPSKASLVTRVVSFDPARARPVGALALYV